MKIIITMAGFGNRFKQIGIQKPKHEIIARKKSLFYWSLSSLTDFFNEEFILITRRGAYSNAFIEKECSDLGIKKFSIVEVNELTDGQASSAFLADPYIKAEDSVIIFNIDTYIEPGVLQKDKIGANAFGYTPAFVADGDKWSFVKTEDKNSLRVIEVSEKVRISDLGTIGFYYFKYWSDYRLIYETYKESIKQQYKETHVAPMYKYLLNEGKAVYTEIIDSKYIHVLGTPEDIENFDSGYLSFNLETK